MRMASDLIGIGLLAHALREVELFFFFDDVDARRSHFDFNLRFGHRLVGRFKEIINCGGEKVSPRASESDDVEDAFEKAFDATAEFVAREVEPAARATSETRPATAPVSPSRLPRADEVEQRARRAAASEADAWTAADADLNFGLLLGAGAPGDASETNNGDDASKRRERAHSLKELLATERVYRDQLACVVERLQRPLAWACAGGPAPADAADTRALPGAEVARALHAALDPLPAAALLAISDALIAQLAARTADGGTEKVGEVFEAAAPKVLEAMCSWYDWHERAASELRRLTEASAGARAFVRRAEADERCGDGRAARRGTPT